MITDIDALSAAADEASEFLKSLASPVRLRILCSVTGRSITSATDPEGNVQAASRRRPPSGSSNPCSARTIGSWTN